MAKHIHIHIHRKTKDSWFAGYEQDQASKKFRAVIRKDTKIKWISEKLFSTAEAAAIEAGRQMREKGVKDAAEPTAAEIQAYVNLRKETDKLAAAVEKKEDQGVFVSPQERQKLRELTAKENAVRNEVKWAARAKGLI